MTTATKKDKAEAKGRGVHPGLVWVEERKGRYVAESPAFIDGEAKRCYVVRRDTLDGLWTLDASSGCLFDGALPDASQSSFEAREAALERDEIIWCEGCPLNGTTDSSCVVACGMEEPVDASLRAEGIGMINDEIIRANMIQPADRLPIPRPSDVSVDLIDVVHNIRSQESLLDGSIELLGENMESQNQVETVKLMRLAGGRFRLLDGERRFRAAKAVGMASLRAEVYDQELTESQILRLQLTTFVTKKSATHRELAMALADYSKQTGLSGAPLARCVGMSEDNVRKHLAYAELGEYLRFMINIGQLSLNKGLVIGRLPADLQPAMAQRAYLHGLSEQQVTEEVKAKQNPPTAGLGLETAGAGSREPVAGGEETEGTRANSAEGAEEDSTFGGPGVCRVCGCTNERGCAEGCRWTDEHNQELCTRCADDDGEGAGLAVLLRFGLDEKAVQAMAEASLLTIGDLAELSRKHGTFWHRMVKGIGEAAAGRIDDALLKFHEARLGGLPSSPAATSRQARDSDDGVTDEHDQVNERRRAKAEGAPIKGTKGETAAERHERAKAESDAAAGQDVPEYPWTPQAIKTATGPAKGGIGFAGKIALAQNGLVFVTGSTVTIKIGEKVLLLPCKQIVLEGLSEVSRRKVGEAVESWMKGNELLKGGKKVAGSQSPVAGKEIPDQLADALAVNIMTLRAAMAEAIEHCETCRGLDAHDLGRCARCQTFIRLLHDVHATAKETRK